MDWKLHSPDNYFTKKQYTEVWVKGGKPFEVTTWRRPLAEISREISEAGLVVSRIDEPMPQPSFTRLSQRQTHTFGADRTSCSSV